MSRLKDIKEMTEEDLVQWLAGHGIKPYRATQIRQWIYMRQSDNFSDMTNLSKDLRELLADHFTIDRLNIKKVMVSADGTRKYLFRLRDLTTIESVLIPEKNHFTLCVSSQVGCALGCRFCRTARDGLIRNLTSGEIIAQVRDLIHIVDSDHSDPRRLTNLVFMGMGEPLANYKNLVSSLKTLTCNNSGLKMSARRITVSTAGLVPQLAALGRETSVNPAISLNAADNDTRSRLMPVNRKYPIEELIETCRNYPLRPHGMMTVEYILIKGVNDSPKDAERLLKLLKPIRAKINLIPFNEFEGCEFRRPEEPVIENFQKILMNQNYTVIVRRSKGADIAAACGQLRAATEMSLQNHTMRSVRQANV